MCENERSEKGGNGYLRFRSGVRYEKFSNINELKLRFSLDETIPL